MRSERITQGPENGCYRSLHKSMGYSDDDLNRPILLGQFILSGDISRCMQKWRLPEQKAR